MTVAQAVDRIAPMFGYASAAAIPAGAITNQLLSAVNSAIQEIYTRAPRYFARKQRSYTILVNNTSVTLNADDIGVLGPVWISDPSTGSGGSPLVGYAYNPKYFLQEISSREEFDRLITEGGLDTVPGNAALFAGWAAIYRVDSDNDNTAADGVGTKTIQFDNFANPFGGTRILYYIARTKAPTFATLTAGTNVPVPYNYAELIYLPVLRWHCIALIDCAEEDRANTARIQADYEKAIQLMDTLNINMAQQDDAMASSAGRSLIADMPTGARSNSSTQLVPQP